MRAMMYVSLILNLCVLFPVCAGLFSGAAWTLRAYGEPTAARHILLSVYFAIALVSLLLLIRPEPRSVATLLLLQVTYKLLTPFMVGNLQNPVVLSNIGISAVHAATLTLIWRATHSASGA